MELIKENEKKIKIMEVSFHLFCQKGIENTTVSEITTKARPLNILNNVFYIAHLINSFSCKTHEKLNTYIWKV